MRPPRDLQHLVFMRESGRAKVDVLKHAHVARAPSTTLLTGAAPARSASTTSPGATSAELRPMMSNAHDSLATQ